MRSLFAIALATLLVGTVAEAESNAPEWFRAIDRDKDGVISLDELHHARYQRFARVDADRDGRLSPVELRGQRAWLSRFAWFDSNRDGRISIDEFETKGLARFAMLDKDGDGRITIREAQSIAKAAYQRHGDTSG